MKWINFSVVYLWKTVHIYCTYIPWCVRSTVSCVLRFMMWQQFRTIDSRCLELSKDLKKDEISTDIYNQISRVEKEFRSFEIRNLVRNITWNTTRNIFLFLIHKAALKFYLQKIVKFSHPEITRDNKSLSGGQKISSR